MATDDSTEYAVGPGAEDEPVAGERDRRRFGALILTILVALIVLWWILTQTTVVPDVTGLGPEGARSALNAASLKVGDVTVVRTSQQPVGRVADQTPFAGSRVLKGAEVDIALAVRAGDADAGAPGGAGEGEGIVIDLGDFESESTFEEQPKPRTYPEVSGPYVPTVQALTEAEAISELRAAGYSVRVKYGPVSSGPGEGEVYFQEPEPEAYAPRGTVVEIWVSTGGPPSGPHPVPRVDE